MSILDDNLFETPITEKALKEKGYFPTADSGYCTTMRTQCGLLMSIIDNGSHILKGNWVGFNLQTIYDITYLEEIELHINDFCAFIKKYIETHN